MTDWVTFEGRVVPLTWGRATYTILPVPDPVLKALGKARRVEGEIAEHPVNLALSRAPVIEGAFLWTGASLLDRIGITPGEPIEVRLRPAPDDRVDLDPDIEAALRAGDLLSKWESLTPGKRRGLLYQIATARTDSTRRTRIAKLLEDLS
jgi:Bacteriocin-protection, YdeI or OmpD-Associated